MIDMLDSRKEPVNAGISVALTVRGTLVSGEIIPHWQWFDEQTESTARSRTSRTSPRS